MGGDSRLVDFSKESSWHFLERHLTQPGGENKENESDLNSTIDFLSDLVGQMAIDQSTRSFLVGNEPSKTDNDVFSAINTKEENKAIINKNNKKYSNLFLWYQRVEGYSPASRAKWKTVTCSKPKTKSTGSSPVRFPAEPSPVSVRVPRGMGIDDSSRKRLLFDIDI